jgi:hypothetical protein
MPLISIATLGTGYAGSTAARYSAGDRRWHSWVREGRDGIEAVLRHLHKMAFGGSVAEKRPGQ